MKQRITSIHYPVAIDQGLGTLLEEHNYARHVEQLIMQVLLTSPGERINRSDFGCGLRQMVFSPNSDVSANLTQVMVVQALEKWLAQVISVNNVTVKAVNETLEVAIAYVLNATQERRYLNVEVTL